MKMITLTLGAVLLCGTVSFASEVTTTSNSTIYKDNELTKIEMNNIPSGVPINVIGNDGTVAKIQIDGAYFYMKSAELVANSTSIPTNSTFASPAPTPTTSTTTPTPEPTTPTGGLGGDLVYTDSFTTPILGVTLPVLNKFNNAGFNDDADFLAGDINDPNAIANFQVMLNKADEMYYALIEQGYLAGNSVGFTFFPTFISFSNIDSAGMDLCVGVYDSETYKITINQRLSDDEYQGVYPIGKSGRDVLLFMCSIISSEPVSLYNTIYADIEVVETVTSTEWFTIADFQIKRADDHAYNKFTYLVKAR